MDSVHCREACVAQRSTLSMLLGITQMAGCRCPPISNQWQKSRRVEDTGCWLPPNFCFISVPGTKTFLSPTLISVHPYTTWSPFLCLVHALCHSPAFWSFLSHAQSFQRAGTCALDDGTLLWVSTSVYSFKACSCFRHSCVALQKLLLSRIQRNCFMLFSLGHLW